MCSSILSRCQPKCWWSDKLRTFQAEPDDGRPSKSPRDQADDDHRKQKRHSHPPPKIPGQSPPSLTAATAELPRHEFVVVEFIVRQIQTVVVGVIAPAGFRARSARRTGCQSPWDKLPAHGTLTGRFEAGHNFGICGSQLLVSDGPLTEPRTRLPVQCFNCSTFQPSPSHYRPSESSSAVSNSLIVASVSSPMFEMRKVRPFSFP